MNKAAFLLILLFTFNSLHAQDWPAPSLPDTTAYGKYTSRTLNLLHSGTKSYDTVRILVYGQSISAQDWWLEVKKTIEKRFPRANLLMENKAIGGFATQMLCKTVEMDVSAFYPDLVLLHVYGNDKMFDSVLFTIRSRTAAEVAIQTDHFTGENAWSDSMSYKILPALAEKYKCDIINIRDPWKKYLADNGLKPKDLLTDDVHLNKQGEFLMAELIKPLFQYKSKFEPDPFGLCTTFVAGKDFKVKKGKAELTFAGNQVDIVYEKKTVPSKMKVLLDGRKPSEFQGTYFMTRPYSYEGKSWPWTLPAMIHIRHEAPWISEEWTMIYLQAEPPYDDFTFTIKGSVTGNDGSGTASEDFISRSKRVIIRKGDAEKGGDWHLNRSYKVLKTTVTTGDEINWKTYSISTDLWETDLSDKGSETGLKTLFRGVPNSFHNLSLIPSEKNIPSIKEIRIYRPYYGRK